MAESLDPDLKLPFVGRVACICRMVRRCLRDCRWLVRSQSDNSAVYASSWLGLFLWGYLGEVSPLVRYLIVVLRDSFVRLAISRIEILSRRCQRRITLNRATSITPVAPARAVSRGWEEVAQISTKITQRSGSVLDGTQQQYGLLFTHSPSLRLRRESLAEAGSCPDKYSHPPRTPIARIGRRAPGDRRRVP